MPEIKAAVEAATARIHELAEEIGAVRGLLIEEREARQRDREENEARVAQAKKDAAEAMEAARLHVRRGHRRLIVAVVVIAVLLVASVASLVRVLHENEEDRCVRSNDARRGIRVALTIALEGDREVADTFLDEAEANPRNQTPEAKAYIEGRRALIERRQDDRGERVAAALDELLPITEC